MVYTNDSMYFVYLHMAIYTIREALLGGGGGGGTNVASLNFKTCYVAIWGVGYVPVVISRHLTMYAIS